MALVTYPLNNIDYTAEDAELYHCTRTSGVFAAEEDYSASVTGTDNIVTIGQGIAWIRNSRFSGKVVANKESTQIDMGIADGSYPRIDAIVIRFDANNNQSDIISKQGVASSSPVAPEVVRTESLYELHLYHVRRRAGATSILSSDITDLRSDSNYCGVMSDDVTNLGDDYVNKAQIGVADGVASLDASGKVPSSQLPSLNYIPTSQKGAASGVASLDSSGKVPTSQLDYREQTGTISGKFTTSHQECECRVRSGVCYVSVHLEGTATESVPYTEYIVAGVPKPKNLVGTFTDLHGTAIVERDGASYVHSVYARYYSLENTMKVVVDQPTDSGQAMYDYFAFSYTCV